VEGWLGLETPSDVRLLECEKKNPSTTDRPVVTSYVIKSQHVDRYICYHFFTLQIRWSPLQIRTHISNDLPLSSSFRIPFENRELVSISFSLGLYGWHFLCLCFLSYYICVYLFVNVIYFTSRSHDPLIFAKFCTLHFCPLNFNNGFDTKYLFHTKWINIPL
jgi:hypothetical protein